MTSEEAINFGKRVIRLGLKDETHAFCELSIKALQKQTPQMVLFESDGFADGNPVYDMASCPDCGYSYEEGDRNWGEPFCPHCGQALKWKDDEE